MSFDKRLRLRLSITVRSIIVRSIIVRSIIVRSIIVRSIITRGWIVAWVGSNQVSVLNLYPRKFWTGVIYFSSSEKKCPHLLTYNSSLVLLLCYIIHCCFVAL